MIKLAFGFNQDDEWNIDCRMVQSGDPPSTNFQLVFIGKEKQESEELVIHLSRRQFEEMIRRGQIFTEGGKEMSVMKQTQNNEEEELDLGDFTLEDLLANHEKRDSAPDDRDTMKGETGQIAHKETLDWWKTLPPEQKGALLGLYRQMCADHPTLYEDRYGPIEPGQIPLEWLVIEKQRLQRE